MNRWLVFIYGLASYLLFLGVFGYAILFIGNIGIAKTLDAVPNSSLGFAVVINALLLTLFAVQHSLMARPFFKRWLTQSIPKAAERATYVLASNLAMIALFLFWEPMGFQIWNLSNPVAVTILYSLFFAGWGLIFLSTVWLNHFDIFGLRQVWLYFQKREYTSLRFEMPGLYRYIRHPLYVGWFIVFWATPTMTAGHLFFAVLTTAYILVAVRLEERDLIDEHGTDYLSYRNEVPMFVPRITKPEVNELGEHHPV